MSAEPERPDADPMGDAVRRFDKRRRRWLAEAGHTLLTAVAVAGLGWLVAVPALAGFAAGHWLDARYHTGIAFAAGLGLLGLALGCASAWRRVARHREPDRRKNDRADPIARR